MNHWLVKSEPSAWSWDQMVAAKTTAWSGVRNNAAALHLRAMKHGDLAFFYHSNEGKEIVGVVEIVREAYIPTRPTRPAATSWSMSKRSARSKPP